MIQNVEGAKARGGDEGALERARTLADELASMREGRAA